MSDAARTRLAKILDGLPHQFFSHAAKSDDIADALLKAGVTLPDPPAPVWPVTTPASNAARGAYAAAVDDGRCPVGTGCAIHTCSHRMDAALAAAAPHLVRAWIEGLTVGQMQDVYQSAGSSAMRAALLRLAGKEG